MSIVHMYNFDHFPKERTLTPAIMAAEGYPEVQVGVTNATFRAAWFNNRSWLVANLIQAGPYGNAATRAAAIFNQVPLRAVFGDPKVVTSGVIACRIYLSEVAVTRWASYGSYMTVVNGNAVDNSVLRELTAGEHFVEVEFDFVGKTVKTYIDTLLFATVSIPAMSLDSVMQFGAFTVLAQNMAAFDGIYFNDMYVTYDNQNGEPSGRLGIVRVMGMPVDEITTPSDWSYADDDSMLSYTDFDTSEVFKTQLLIPPAPGVQTLDGEFDLQISPTVSIPTAIPSWLMPNGSATFLSVSGLGPAMISATFTRPKKASGYAFQAYNSGNGAFDTWVFQGSNDGVTWVDLDSREGLGPSINSIAGRICAFQIPKAKQGFYTRYRLNVSKSTIGANSRVYLRHVQILGDVADMLVNSRMDGLQRPSNANLTDLDFPVIRGAVSGSEAVFGFKAPSVGPADILHVQCFALGRNEQGSDERLAFQGKVGESRSPEKAIVLKSHGTTLVPVGEFRQKPDGTPWTQADLDAFQVVVKSKRGA